MVTTAVLIVLQLAVLFGIGCAALAVVQPAVRRTLLPAAPVFGAALIACITNWTSRWLSITWSLPIIGAIVVALLVAGWRTGRLTFERPKRWWAGLLLGTCASLLGVGVAAVPVAVVGDSNAVVSAYVADANYFGGASTWLVDHPLLPGPTISDAWEETDAPSDAPAADIVRHRLRFGQSATAAALSVVLFTDPFSTLSSIPLLWLGLVGAAASVAAALFGLRRRDSLIVAAIVSGSFYTVSQSIEGKNDGLLGVSMATIALVLSFKLLDDRRYSWPLILTAAGLAATYSEYLIMFVPALVAIVLVGPRATLLDRLNLLAGRWAASVVLVPWAWIWLAQSFKNTTRFTNGPTPFADRTGWGTLRSYLGVPSFESSPALSALMTGMAAVLAIALVVGLVAFVRRHRAGMLLVGFGVVVLGLEVQAALVDAGLIQYRVMQLAFPIVLLFSSVGWVLLCRDRQWTAWRRIRLAPVAAVAAVLFVGSNLSAAALSTSHERARVQHIPQKFTDAVLSLAERVGGQNLTVVMPSLTDSSAISMVLHDHAEVQYAAVPASITYVGLGPRWDRTPDGYYVLGPGATLTGEATLLTKVDDYRIVTLGESGMVLAPLGDEHWGRLTYMRGFPCVRDDARFILIRGGGSSARFGLALKTPSGNVSLIDEFGDPVKTARTTRTGGWAVRTFKAPAQRTSVLALRWSGSLEATEAPAVPLRFVSGSDTVKPLLETDSDLTGLADLCLSGLNDGMDGYDREITYMRTAR